MSELEVETHDSIEEVNRNQWNNLVEHSGVGGVFHRYGWLECVERGTDLEARHAVVLKNGNPIAALPNFITEVEGTPFRRLESIGAGYGGPLITTEEDRALQLLLEAASDACGGGVVSHKISTHDSGYVRYQDPLERRGYRPTLTNCRFVVDLRRGWIAIREGMEGSRRRDLDNALEQDHEVVEDGVSQDVLMEFYDSYSSVIDRVDGRKYPREFFRCLADRFTDRVAVFRAVVDGRSVGRFLHLLDDERGSVHHFFSAVEQDYFEYYPSELLHAYSMRWGMENGYTEYDFGATRAHFEDGVYRFKQRFGGDAEPSLTWEKGYSRVGWGLLRLGRRVARQGWK